MSLQMQIHRGLIALAIALALGGLALGSASTDDTIGARGVGTVIRAVQKDNPPVMRACASRSRAPCI
jgi:F0F1-type ATP synthase membrane subunit c/vacuolar-type H+-ATPase subunit K